MNGNTNTNMKMEIEISNETDLILQDHFEDQIALVVKMVLDSEEIHVSGEVSVLFVDNAKIKALNAEFRNKDTVTDVLSFPQYEDIKNKGFTESYIYLGDIVISLDRAKEQAEDFGHTFEREILYLVVHSVFHLLGYDHMKEDDKNEMRLKEKEIFRKIGVFKEKD